VETMRGLSLVGLLVGLGVMGVLMFNQFKPSPETGNSLPTENIEKANQAAETMKNQSEQLQQDLQKTSDQ
jgi:Tfp pilus assembly protein PilN